MALSTSYFVLHSLFRFSLFIRLFALYLALLSLSETFFSHFIKLTTFQPIVRKRIDFLDISHFSVCLTEKEKEKKICSFCFVLNQLIDLNPLLYFIIHFVFTFRCTKCRVFFTLAFGWQRFHFMLNNRIFSLPLHYFTLLLVFFPLFTSIEHNGYSNRCQTRQFIVSQCMFYRSV